MQEVSVDQKANTAQLEKKAPASAVKEEKTVADPTPAKEQNATSKQDSASAQTSQPAVDSVKQNAKKTQQVGNDKAALATTITLNEPKSSVVELTESKATVQDENSTTVVTSAKELIDAIQKGTANTINIGANIDLGTISSYSSYTNTNISNKRNIIIQSVAGKHCTVDFNGYGFNMYSSDYGVTFKNLDLYGRSYYGIVRSAGSYTFDNVNYTGAELIYTDPGYNTTVNFDGNVTAHSVGSYTAPLNGKLRLCQGGNNQQVIQFADGKNTINFNSGSDVTLTTTNSNVVEVDKGTTTINIKNGAKVSLNPHTHFFPEQHRMSMDGIARGISSNGDDTTLNIDQGGNLDINLTKNIKGWFSSDQYLSGALYLNSGGTINVNGNLNIYSDGQPYYPFIPYNYQGWADPVYINGKATINVNGGSFKVNATNIGDYKGSIVTSNGNSTIAINHHGTFDVTGDGAKATGVSLGNGSTFTSTQPELFNISMPDGATAIKNGKVQFKGVKTSTGGQPIGEIDIIYDSNGTPKVTKVTSYDKDTTTATRTAGNNAKNKINLVDAGKEVDLKGITFTKDADGNYIMSGNANTADNNSAYVYISVNGTVHQVAPTDSQTLYTVGPTGGPTSSQVPYTAETGADGKFSVNLGKLKDTDQVSVYGAKDFVTSDTDTKTVSDWMTSSYRDQLQKLVDEKTTVESGFNFTNATDNLKAAYTNAIKYGSTLLQNSSATSEQLGDAVSVIVNAKTALNGDLNKVKQDLQAAVDAASDFENTSATYYNAASAKQQAYNTAISAGSDALKAQNPTVESLTTALNKINEAKSALDGKATDTSKLKAAVDNANTVKASNDYKDASADDQKQYDDAVKAGQQLLDPTTAPSPLTQADVDRAAKAITDAQSALTTSATTNVKDAKGKATADLTNAVDAAKKAIDQDTNLTEDERNAAKAQVDSDASAAKEAINKATTNDAVTSAATAGKVTIDKTVANAAIDNAAAGKNKAIDGSSLTDEEKNSIKDQVAQAVKTAKDIISAADTEQAVTTAQKNGVAAIDGIKVSANSTAKDQAKSNITDAADKAKQTIDQDNNLTNDQKQAAKDQVDTDVKNAQDAIDNAKTDADVNNTADNGKIAIDKTVADAAIDNAVAGKIKDVKAPVTTDEQKTLTDLIKETGENAKQNIANATTPAEVTIAQAAGVNAIDQINVPTTSPVKDAADKAIDEALKNKTAAINKADNITDQEKHSLIDKVNKAADDATSAIKNATTDNAVKDAETKGLNEINGVTIPTLAEKQQAANVAIDQAAKAKKAEIAKALQAGNIDQAKADSLNTEVDNDVTNAMKAIANATTNAAVVVAQNDGIHKIKAIKVPSSTYNPDITNNTSTGSGDTDSTSTKPAEEATLKLILTHNAYIYNKDYQITYKDNKRVVLKKGTQILALDNGKKYLIKGKEFYRIGDNQYVKVSNTISYYYLVHNSFLYNKHGKTIKRNGKRILVRKGVRLESNKVKVVKINGKKFYKVGKSTYIKFRNAKLIISPNN